MQVGKLDAAFQFSEPAARTRVDDIPGPFDDTSIWVRYMPYCLVYSVLRGIFSVPNRSVHCFLMQHESRVFPIDACQGV